MKKNPKRVAAGRRNRAKRGSLSDAAKQLLSEAAKQNRPWESATGPKTQAGKAKSAKNRKGKGAKTDETERPITDKACNLLSQITAIRRSVIVDPESADVVEGRETAEMLHEILANASKSELRREVDALMDDAARCRPQE